MSDRLWFTSLVRGFHKRWVCLIYGFVYEEREDSSYCDVIELGKVTGTTEGHEDCGWVALISIPPDYEAGFKAWFWSDKDLDEEEAFEHGVNVAIGIVEVT